MNDAILESEWNAALAKAAVTVLESPGCSLITIAERILAEKR